ncbi:hypothetical protein GMSM_05630 [Geomonas sp. Red276]
MKKVLTLVALLLVSQSAYAFECHECHSKNPAMVKMHKALEGRNCFDCHKIGEKLMGKAVPKDKSAQLRRSQTDPMCVECHKKKS